MTMNISPCSQQCLTAAHRALTAAAAGAYLSEQMGLDTPIPAALMWKYAREEEIPAVRLGRRVWFRTDILDTIALGHNARASHV
jgi:hypothetical protein